MSSPLFTRIAGGRVHASDHRTDISLRGDTTVGTRVVDNLAFTI